MWINRHQKSQDFVKIINNLNNQVLIVRGARQVGKTSFVAHILDGLTDVPQVCLNLLYPSRFQVGSKEFFGREFFGKSPEGEDLITNIGRNFGGLHNLKQPAVVFIDEADRFPQVLEAIQTLSGFSTQIKFIITGYNLENVAVKNAATGRKCYFDLYPVTFFEFLEAAGRSDLKKYAEAITLTKLEHSAFYHGQLTEEFRVYARLGGMPRLVDAYLDPQPGQTLAHIVADLAFSIEENVKTVLGAKASLYEYHDVLRTLARLSLNTLKFSRLQVQHAGRSEAQRLVAKTVGARVAHKIRLMDADSDLSKYVLFDVGIANFLLNGSDLLHSIIPPAHAAILAETVTASEIIAGLTTRDDLFYWKSGNVAELEFLLRSPLLAGIDVKTTGGHGKSLASFALNEEQAGCLVKIADVPPAFLPEYTAKIATQTKTRQIPLVTIPHYLAARVGELLEEVREGITGGGIVLQSATAVR